jgi:hypothetical protein
MREDPSSAVLDRCERVKSGAKKKEEKDEMWNRLGDGEIHRPEGEVNFCTYYRRAVRLPLLPTWMAGAMSVKRGSRRTCH